MHKMCHYGSIVLLTLMASGSQASLVLEDFESSGSSLPSGWTVAGVTGTSWKVGGTTGGNPNPIVTSPQGLSFARSGEPNLPTESDTGTLTSPSFLVTFDKLEWFSSGWSGGASTADGSSYFQILDGTFAEKVRINPAQSDTWKTETVNLLNIGLLPGSTFYFRAVDGRNQANYGWIAFDKLELTGSPVAAVPEASCVLVWSLLSLAVSGYGCLRRERV